MSSRCRPRRALPPARRTLPPARRPQSGRLAAACQVLAARRALANSLAAEKVEDVDKFMHEKKIMGVQIGRRRSHRSADSTQTSAVSGVVAQTRCRIANATL